METSSTGPDQYRSPSVGGGASGNGGTSSRRYGVQLSASNLLQAPISALLEYSGILRPRAGYPENENLIGGGGVGAPGLRDHASSRLDDAAVSSSGDGEVSIRIIGAGDQDGIRVGAGPPQQLVVGPGRERNAGENVQTEHVPSVSDRQSGDIGNEGGIAEGTSSSMPSPISSGSPAGAEGEAGSGVGGNNRDSPYQRYDIQQAARWIEQILPFSLLLLVVFIRQHLQGFFVTIWIAAVMFKSNDVLRKQTALKNLLEELLGMEFGIGSGFRIGHHQSGLDQSSADLLGIWPIWIA
ncbi:hypothetical protein Taro_046374 [Colocasia esculenta]|uniref:Uncharacterized protein n=1 Tax=Colocasia esculenta TaxID=4460 RepID=A0A843WS69_COLES|nr:hypothetical protein [Colocasia esculenta]